jgi:hypothetical protein
MYHLTYGVRGSVPAVPARSTVGRPLMNKNVFRNGMKKHFFISCVLFPLFVALMVLDVFGLGF